MVEVHDKVTRFSADLVNAAAAEGARQSRSARQQLDHWVRVGRAVSSVSSAQRTRVESALAGRLPMHELSEQESTVVNAEIAAAIEENVLASHLGSELAAEGITTVALDEEGRLVEYRPDGSSSVISEA
ncbi:MAG: hypothetical protein JWP10_657 [Nocardioidaceae bacterium]|nr:hypothetical protein [Nocardioidaceae bacterium]